MLYLIFFFIAVFFLSIFCITLGFMSQLIFLIISLSSLIFAMCFGYKVFKKKSSSKHELNQQLLIVIVDRFSKLSISFVKFTKNIINEKDFLEIEIINEIKNIIEFDNLICKDNCLEIKDKKIKKLWKKSCSDLSKYFSNNINYNTHWKNEIITEIENKLICLIEIKSIIFSKNGEIPHSFLKYNLN